jgi:hypothetical protein
MKHYTSERSPVSITSRGIGYTKAMMRITTNPLPGFWPLMKETGKVKKISRLKTARLKYTWAIYYDTDKLSISSSCLSPGASHCISKSLAEPIGIPCP